MKKILQFILVALFLLMLFGCSRKNPYESDILIGYRIPSESTFGENNIFYIDDDIYIKITAKDYYSSTSGKYKSKIGTFIITFNDLVEKEEPLQVGGNKLEPIFNSDPSIKQYEFTVEFKQDKDTAWATFHMTPSQIGLIQFTIELKENNLISYVGVLEIRGYDE